MKRNLFTLLMLVSILFIYNNKAFSQGGGNTTPDFTNLNDPAVTCYYGTFSDPFQTTGIMSGRHTVITNQGYDIETGNQLPYLPPGENRVIRLGNSNTGSQAEAIRYRFTVDYFKSTLLLQFAVVFEDPGHPTYEQPRFTVRVTDLNGQLVESCAEYDVTAAGYIPGFNSYGGTRWRPWTNVGIDLSPYIGSEIIVEFITKDCDQSGHFGYAYYTASCISNNLEINDCNGNDITLRAPDNFQSYLWSNGSTSQQTQFTVSNESLDAYCDITSVTGCVFRLNAHITKESGLPIQDTIIYDSICFGYPYELNFFNLPIQNTPGDYVFLNTLCDLNKCNYTTITLLLNVSNKVPDVIIYDSICHGDTYDNYGFLFNNLAIGKYTYITNDVTKGGCDSTTILHLDVTERYDEITIDGLNEVIVSSDLITGYYKYTCNKYPNCNQYNWSIENSDWLIFPDQNECLILATTPTSNILTVTAENRCGTFHDSIYINANFIITDKLKEKDIRIFPNPTKGIVTIAYSNIMEVCVYNNYGQLLIKNNYDSVFNTTIDLSSLESSSYIIKVTTSKETITKHISLIK